MPVCNLQVFQVFDACSEMYCTNIGTKVYRWVQIHTCVTDAKLLNRISRNNTLAAYLWFCELCISVNIWSNLSGVCQNLSFGVVCNITIFFMLSPWEAGSGGTSCDCLSWPVLSHDFGQNTARHSHRSCSTYPLYLICCAVSYLLCLSLVMKTYISLFNFIRKYNSMEENGYRFKNINWSGV